MEVWIRNRKSITKYLRAVAIEFLWKSCFVRRYESESIRKFWQYENRYDSDNATTFDSDNDSNGDGCDSDG